MKMHQPGFQQGHSLRLFAATVLANAMFWASVWGFAALRTDGYSHLTDAVSELGVVGAPNALAFNVLGYITPGLLLIYSGWSIGRRTAGGILTPLLLSALGGGLLLAGLSPADLSNMQSPATILHLAGSTLGLVCVLGWLVLGIKAWRTTRAAAAWALIGAVMFAAAFCVYGLTPFSGLVQRLTFAVALFWYPVAALVIRR